MNLVVRAPSGRAEASAGERGTGQTAPVDGAGRARGVVQLINSSDGGVLCLAGAVSAEVVGAFYARHGREPLPVAAIDGRSVTALSAAGLELVRDHLAAAERAGRTVRLQPVTGAAPAHPAPTNPATTNPAPTEPAPTDRGAHRP